MAKIRKIEPVMPTLPTRKKVAAYARVSMENGSTTRYQRRSATTAI